MARPVHRFHRLPRITTDTADFRTLVGFVCGAALTAAIAVGCSGCAPTACYQLVGAAGSHVVVMNGCTGNLELRATPERPPSVPSTTLPDTPDTAFRGEWEI